jgi:hypothetical protein
MSCGGKLSDLIEKIEEKDDYVEDLPEIKQEDEEIFVLEEVSDDDSVVIETNDISTDKQDIEIEINGSVTDESAGEPELKIEKDSKKASEDSAKSKNETDKRIVSPNAPQNKKSKKEPVQSKGDIDLDSLFNELTSLDGSEQLSAGESSDVPPPEGMSVESVSSNEKDESAFNLKSE